MTSCKINTSEPWKTSSIALMKDESYLERVNMHAIRIHMSKYPHFDYAIGNPRDEFCIDFVIPKTNNTVLTTGIPVVPKKLSLVKFMGIHPIIVLTSTRTRKNPERIKEGQYGAGTWWIVKKGNARIKKDKNTWHLCFDEEQYTILEFKGDKGKYYTIRSSSDPKCIV